MRLELSEDQEFMRRNFEQLFAVESSPARVRAAEPLGFDAALWKRMAEAGMFGIRVPAANDGGDASLLDAAVLLYEAGKKLVPGPLLETVVAARLIALIDASGSKALLERILSGEVIASLAFRDLSVEPRQLIAGGAVAHVVVGRRDQDIVLLKRKEASSASPSNLGSSPLAPWDAPDCTSTVLATGHGARATFEAIVEEWKLLTAATLSGLAREALAIGAKYSCERTQFDRPIGTFQGLAHPLAESAAEVEGARLLVWKTTWALATKHGKAGAMLAMCFVWASHAATRAVARALHVHGGYGLSLEYDIQLYHRRAKALAQLFGDPQRELAVIADRLWPRSGACDVALPDAGKIELDYALGEAADAFARTARVFFERNFHEGVRSRAHFAWEGHHAGFHRQLAQAGLLYPSWPKAYGGQERNAYEMRALAQVLGEYGYTTFAIKVTSMVGQTIMKFGSPELKAKVLPKIAAGEVIISLGYTEPESGSDVAAAKTRAVREGDGWVINGQKTFTSGAELADYVFLLTRTNTEGKKHEGLTLFLVPIGTPGVELQAVHTLSDERTNLTFYTDVRVPDLYRVGQVNGGWAALTYALALEHNAGRYQDQLKVVEGALAWAREKQRDGGLAIDEPMVRARIARAAMHAYVSEAITERAFYAAAEGKHDMAAGPMSKFFSTDHFIEDAADLMDLCAPDSLLRGPYGGGQSGAAAVELGYRLSTASSIYGGTTEIMKSIVAQMALGMPRSRS